MANLELTVEQERAVRQFFINLRNFASLDVSAYPDSLGLVLASILNGDVTIASYQDDKKPSSPNPGDLIYNSTFNVFQYWNGSVWKTPVIDSGTNIQNVSAVSSPGTDDGTYARTDHVHGLSELLINNIGIDYVSGLKLRNTTVAIDGFPQASPANEYEGRGWITDFGGSSQTVKLQTRLLPAQSDNALSLARYVLSSSQNGGSFIDFLELSQGEFNTVYISPINANNIKLAYNGLNGGSGPSIVVSANSIIFNAGSSQIAFSDDGSLVFSIELMSVSAVSTRVQSTAINYSVQFRDYYIGVTDTSSTRTITLPSSEDEGYVDGRVLEIKDESGLAGTNNIIIDRNGSFIEGNGSDYVINTNFGAVTLKLRSSTWWIVNNKIN